MNEIEKYAQDWEKSSNTFFEQGDYKWMARQLKEYKTVLELGCGTGQSTLSLLQQGLNVIAVDKNPSCLSLARKRVEAFQSSSSEAINGTARFIEADYSEPDFVNNILDTLNFDIVVCWNVGTYWDRNMIEKYVKPMLEYGLTADQIKNNPESSYGEYMLWKACQIAAFKSCAVQIVDRSAEKVTKLHDPYYKSLKKEFLFKTIHYENHKTYALSSNGRKLTIKGREVDTTCLKIYLVSVLMK